MHTQCLPPTSQSFSPARVEPSPADVGVGLEAHREQVAGAGDVHWAGCGGAELGQLGGQQVWASIHLEEGSEVIVKVTLPSKTCLLCTFY